MPSESPNGHRDVVFSEIMWGSDDSLTVVQMHSFDSQWIELYNVRQRAIDLMVLVGHRLG